MNRTKAAVIGAFLLFALACGPSPSSNTPLTANKQTEEPQLPPVDDLAMGRSLYTQSCAICHKENGTGGKMTIEDKTLEVRDLTSDKAKDLPDDEIAATIYNGVTDKGMPPFREKLTEAQIREVVMYVRVGIQERSPDVEKREQR